jgi:hypothetical protein
MFLIKYLLGKISQEIKTFFCCLFRFTFLPKYEKFYGKIFVWKKSGFLGG